MHGSHANALQQALPPALLLNCLTHRQLTKHGSRSLDVPFGARCGGAAGLAIQVVGNVGKDAAVPAVVCDARPRRCRPQPAAPYASASAVRATTVGMQELHRLLLPWGGKVGRAAHNKGQQPGNHCEAKNVHAWASSRVLASDKNCSFSSFVAVKQNMGGVRAPCTWRTMPLAAWSGERGRAHAVVSAFT
jgi:hypothetical protein